MCKIYWFALQRFVSQVDDNVDKIALVYLAQFIFSTSWRNMTSSNEMFGENEYESKKRSKRKVRWGFLIEDKIRMLMISCEYFKSFYNELLIGSFHIIRYHWKSLHIVLMITPQLLQIITHALKKLCTLSYFLPCNIFLHLLEYWRAKNWNLRKSFSIT